MIDLPLHFKMHLGGGECCRHFKPRLMITFKLRLDLPPIITEQEAWWVSVVYLNVEMKEKIGNVRVTQQYAWPLSPCAAARHCQQH